MSENNNENDDKARDFSPEESKRRMDAAQEALRSAFAVARMGNDVGSGARLAFALMEDAMTTGKKIGDAKRMYVHGTTESVRRDAGAIVHLLAQMTDKMQDVLAQVSYTLGDKFAVTIEEAQAMKEFDCGNPDCPIHGKNAAKIGDILRPDQLTMLPDEVAAAFGKLIEQGLIVKHVSKSGPFGAMELHGPKHLLEQADKIIANAGGTQVSKNVAAIAKVLPDNIAKEINAPPMDSQTKEISDALDRAFGRDRKHLPDKDIPVS